jgi:hypothetical protein
MLLQIIITILVILSWWSIIQRKRAAKITWSQAVTWLVLWLAVLIVFWYPDLSSRLANILGIGRGADLIIYLSILVIFYMLFQLYLRLDKINSDVTKVVRRVGLDEAQNKTEK